MIRGKSLQPVHDRMRAWCFFACVLAVLALPDSGLAADAGAARRYALPAHGFFQLSVPSGWTDQLDQKAPAPQISLRPSQGQPFIVGVTPVWQRGAGDSAAAREQLRGRVREMADAIRLFAVESDIKVIEFKGAAGSGYYFFATDSAPASGGYKFMHRGMLKVGDLDVTFTILTDEGQDAIVRAAFEMLKSAAHVPR